MMDMKEGVMPETGIIHGESWWICGFCMELICETEMALPDKCPHCGTRIKKGGKHEDTYCNTML